MTDRIDHAAEARRLMDLTGEGYVVHEGWTETTALMATLDAQTHASLALVEQQRIANLIALAALVDQPTTHESLSDAAYGALDAILSTVLIDPDDEHVVLDPEIAAALGIEAVDHD